MKRINPGLLAALPVLALVPLAALNADARMGQFYRQRLQPIDRSGFYWVNHLGRGIDDQGYYRQPVRSTEAFGAELPNGWNYAPMAFDDQGTAALYWVQDGYITRQDYQWAGGVQ